MKNIYERVPYQQEQFGALKITYIVNWIKKNILGEFDFASKKNKNYKNDAGC